MPYSEGMDNISGKELDRRAERAAEDGLLTLVPLLLRKDRRQITRRPVDAQQWVLAGLS